MERRTRRGLILLIALVIAAAAVKLRTEPDEGVEFRVSAMPAVLIVAREADPWWMWPYRWWHQTPWSPPTKRDRCMTWG